MAKSTRRPQQFYTIVMWMLSIVFAGFLIGLGSLIIKDLPRADKDIRIETFVDAGALSKVDENISAQKQALKLIERNIEDGKADMSRAQADYRSAKSSLDSWLSTRTATESSAQNPDVIRRTQAVEKLKNAERAEGRALEDIFAQQNTAKRALADAQTARRALFSQANPDFRAAKRSQELRVFLFRLALTLPLLLIGAWVLVKKRASSYWPLYRGFVLFALFAFFVELVPYLPSYGGYVRYTVGIILVVVAGHFIIRSMRRYLARKQVEESRSEGERRQSIEYETALKKIAAKTCPGCDRSIVTRENVNTDFCVHCGIRLQETCGGCGERNISFHRFCLCCGEQTPDIGAAAS